MKKFFWFLSFMPFLLFCSEETIVQEKVIDFGNEKYTALQIRESSENSYSQGWFLKIHLTQLDNFLGHLEKMKNESIPFKFLKKDRYAGSNWDGYINEIDINNFELNNLRYVKSDVSIIMKHSGKKYYKELSEEEKDDYDLKGLNSRIRINEELCKGKTPPKRWKLSGVDKGFYIKEADIYKYKGKSYFKNSYFLIALHDGSIKNAPEYYNGRKNKLIKDIKRPSHGLYEVGYCLSYIDILDKGLEKIEFDLLQPNPEPEQGVAAAKYYEDYSETSDQTSIQYRGFDKVYVGECRVPLVELKVECEDDNCIKRLIIDIADWEQEKDCKEYNYYKNSTSLIQNFIDFNEDYEFELSVNITPSVYDDDTFLDKIFWDNMDEKSKYTSSYYFEKLIDNSFKNSKRFKYASMLEIIFGVNMRVNETHWSGKRRPWISCETENHDNYRFFFNGNSISKRALTRISENDFFEITSKRSGYFLKENESYLVNRDRNDDDNVIKLHRINNNTIISLNGRVILNKEEPSLKLSNNNIFINNISSKAMKKRYFGDDYSLIFPELQTGIEKIEITQKLNLKEDKEILQSSEWKGNGSGFIISESGYIVTNHHVVEGMNAFEVEFMYQNQITSFNAKVVKSDATNDLAIIKIDDAKFTNLTNIPYSFKTRSSDVGTEVFALGYPMALTIMGKDIKFTDGKISSKTGFKGDITTYQTTTPIQAGNSGGPLFDFNGNLIGINSSGLDKGLADNVSYSIKSRYLLDLIDVLPESIELPSSKELASKPLTEQIKVLSDYVVLIKVK